VHNATETTANAAYATHLIQSGQVEQVITSVELTDTEKLKITHAINAFNNFVVEYKSKVSNGDFGTSDPMFHGFIIDFELLTVQYKNVSEIITLNYDKYSPEQKLILEDYQNLAISLNGSVDSLVAAGRRHQALIFGIKFAGILASGAL